MLGAISGSYSLGPQGSVVLLFTSARGKLVNDRYWAELWSG
ncbi:hypothetical protein Micau_0297 [Micromonospora aurantiaca ATCC 27029]|nr:hypothetical protein Micau_0297 [Micromonospora aurantiaca ATCC 27029]